MLRALALLSLLAACAASPEVTRRAGPDLYPGETPPMRSLVNTYADRYGVPRSLVHRVIQRESDYRPRARNGPYYGLMQILPQTAQTMGHRGPPDALLEPGTNLHYAVKYLRGAWLVAEGDAGEAVGLYASGYYDAAKRKCLLVATGLNDRETARRCR